MTQEQFIVQFGMGHAYNLFIAILLNVFFLKYNIAMM